MSETDDNNISKIYEAGQQSVYKHLLEIAIRNLPEAKAESYRMERLDTISWLRTQCELYGDNDWPDDLHLIDILNKHLLDRLIYARLNYEGDNEK